MEENFWLAFSMTTFAGLSTGLGSLIALFTKRTNPKLLSISLGFSAGVMVYVSLLEILPEASRELVHYLGGKRGEWLAVIAFFAGMFLIGLIDRLVPSVVNPHEPPPEAEENKAKDTKDYELLRVGVFTALAVGIHNFPEGLATFLSALHDPDLAVPVAIAIAIHNIPEGIAVAVPIFYATGSRRKAFAYSFFSGIAEPVGALVCYLLLMPYISPLLTGMVFASVAGIMTFIAFDELLPAARAYGEHHLSIYGLVAGMIVMAISLLLLK